MEEEVKIYLKRFAEEVDLEDPKNSTYVLILAADDGRTLRVQVAQEAVQEVMAFAYGGKKPAPAPVDDDDIPDTQVTPRSSAEEEMVEALEDEEDPALASLYTDDDEAPEDEEGVPSI